MKSMKTGNSERTRGQFKKGTSGNPRGRPKKVLDFKADLAAALQQTVVLLENGKERHVSSQRALAMTLVAAAINKDIRAVSEFGSTNGQVFGVAPEYNQIRNVPVDTGRWFNDEDNIQRRRVAVVGWELLKNVFPGRPAVDAPLLLNGIRFYIIGVLAKVGKDGNNGTNARIFIPIETMHRLENPGADPLVLIEVQCGDYLGEDDIVRFDDKYGRARAADTAT